MSKIEWTGRTWNPIVGCAVVSPGCKRCYAMRAAWRMGSNPATPHYHGLTRMVNGHPVWTGEMRFHAPALELPLRARKPTTWFVNSMSDLFAEGVQDEWLDQIFAVMALTPQHTYQVLTKRPGRMRAYLRDRETLHRIAIAAVKIGPPLGTPAARAYQKAILLGDDGRLYWPLPLPNVWLGVSIEDQTRAEERVPILLETPAAIRFVSAEPLLSGVDLTALDINGDAELDALTAMSPADHWRDSWAPEVTGTTLEEAIEGFEDWGFRYPPSETKAPALNWVICGGESGPGARPMHPDWARSLRDQCTAAGVPFFFKQWGEWTFASQPGDPGHEEGFAQIQRGEIGSPPAIRVETLLAPDGSRPEPGRGHPDLYPAGTRWMLNVGKKAAGRHLDGVIHDAMPVTS